MNYNPKIHHRRSIRLKGYNYSQAGLYFITLCTQDSLHLFGEITNDEIVLNDSGMMIEKWWNELKNRFPNIKLDEFVVMPNHFHGIIQIINTNTVGADLRVCPDVQQRVCPNNAGEHKKKGKHIGLPLHRMMQWFKTMSTNECRNEMNSFTINAAVDNNKTTPVVNKLMRISFSFIEVICIIYSCLFLLF